MFDGLNYITVYYLSGFSANHFEIWRAHRTTIARTPGAMSFSAYLSWPVQDVMDTEDSRFAIKQNDAGLALEVDWFSEEDIPLTEFHADKPRPGVMLMGKYERETFFVHLD